MDGLNIKTTFFFHLGVPAAVRNVKFKDRTETSVKLFWDPPDLPDHDVVYEIKCYKCSSGSSSGKCKESCGPLVKLEPPQRDLTYTNVTIKGLKEDTEYQFIIYSKNNNSLRINMSNWSRAEKKIKTEGML